MSKSFYTRWTLSLLILAGLQGWGRAAAPSHDEKNRTQKTAASESRESPPRRTSPPEAFEITVTAPRVEIPLKQNPAATTVVETALLRTAPRTIAVDEVLKLVPGVKVDNQADGERVHLSIRGQGLLTERGTRGVRTIVDGIPLNDPSGFVSDFFDIDWASVRRVEIMRGPAAAFYGSGSSGGILNILTRDGGPGALSGSAFLTAGSFGFRKGYAEAGGTAGALNYRFSGAALSGDGYRDHTKYWADNIYGKFRLAVSPAVHLTAVLGWTDFYNQNAEGLNLDWYGSDPGEGRRRANPDAYALEEYRTTPLWYRELFGLDRVPFNEYQKTSRFTSGIAGTAALGGGWDLVFSASLRATAYTEAVPSSIIHRSIDAPALSIQLNRRAGRGAVKYFLTLGADYGRQSVDEYKRPNLGDAVEGPDNISDQTLYQSGAGVFLSARLELGPHWGASASLRYDAVRLRLDDVFKAGGIDLSGRKTFEKATGRLGLTYNPSAGFGLYASWGTGFLPPSTEELSNNPYAFGGFNDRLVPATSTGEELGARGTIGPVFTYDMAVFHLATGDDFGRYRAPWRPLETFYGNVGSTVRYGIEAALGWYPVEPLAVRLAYTYSHFKYGAVQTLDAGTQFHGTWMPNAPEHQLYIDAEWKIDPRWTIGVSAEHVSSWFLDATNRILANGYGRTDPYTLFHVRLGYRISIGGQPWEILLSGRNIFGVAYYGFTEPDPDGNSYQPASTAEWSVGLRAAFGRS